MLSVYHRKIYGNRTICQHKGIVYKLPGIVKQPNCIGGNQTGFVCLRAYQFPVAGDHRSILHDCKQILGNRLGLIAGVPGKFRLGGYLCSRVSRI